MRYVMARESDEVRILWILPQYPDSITFCVVEWRVLKISAPRHVCASRPRATAVNFCPIPRTARFI